jgi:hypothetical protein
VTHWLSVFALLAGCNSARTTSEFQGLLDEIASHCGLHRHHHLLYAASPTEAVLNPLPEVRALPPPEHRIRCVKDELKKIPGATLRGYPF